MGPINLTIIFLKKNIETGDESAFTYYEGTGKGPKEWGHLNPHWKPCEKGKLQSPINIVEEDVQVLPQLGKLKRDYNPAHAIVKNRGHDIAVFVRSFVSLFVSSLVLLELCSINNDFIFEDIIFSI